jgi:predicted glycoside hydrolase/deacetylase ChbG (UPF0249 family)
MKAAKVENNAKELLEKLKQFSGYIEEVRFLRIFINEFIRERSPFCHRSTSICSFSLLSSLSLYS